MALIMEATAAAPIMAPPVQLQSRLAIDLTIEVLDIGMDARITSGDRVTGYGGMASKCGFVAITSCEDTELREGSIGVTSAVYQTVTSPPAKPRDIPTSISRRSWRLK